MIARYFTTFLCLVASSYGLSDNELCLGTCSGEGLDKRCVFKFRMNIYAGETGYYEVEGCSGVQPTLGMEFGVMYTFDQSDETNWFHPLGFAYGPDGVYAANDELEKVVPAPGGRDCAATADCQHAQYKLNGNNLCSSDPCTDAEDFGLDEYEGVWFSGGRDDWIDAGSFTVDVNITDPATTEFFYFCHIHNQMSGRIKILNADGTQKDATDNVLIPYEYHTLSEFDTTCGTHNMSQYEDYQSVCPDMTFLCSDDLGIYGTCMAAIDCAMHVEMRVSGELDPTVTFMHQMIAHHRNAVNMAKILMKLNPGSLSCGTDYDGRRLAEPAEQDALRRMNGLVRSNKQGGSNRRRLQDVFCQDGNEDGGTPALTLLWDIINTQNAQITFMNAWLKDNKQPTHDNCDHQKVQGFSPTPPPAEGESLSTGAIVGIVIGAVLFVVLAVLLTWFFTKSRYSNVQQNTTNSESAKAGETQQQQDQSMSQA